MPASPSHAGPIHCRTPTCLAVPDQSCRTVPHRNRTQRHPSPPNPIPLLAQLNRPRPILPNQTGTKERLTLTRRNKRYLDRPCRSTPAIPRLAQPLQYQRPPNNTPPAEPRLSMPGPPLSTPPLQAQPAMPDRSETIRASTGQTTPNNALPNHCSSRLAPPLREHTCLAAPNQVSRDHPLPNPTTARPNSPSIPFTTTPASPCRSLPQTAPPLLRPPTQTTCRPTPVLSKPCPTSVLPFLSPPLLGTHAPPDLPCPTRPVLSRTTPFHSCRTIPNLTQLHQAGALPALPNRTLPGRTTPYLT